MEEKNASKGCFVYCLVFSPQPAKIQTTDSNRGLISMEFSQINNNMKIRNFALCLFLYFIYFPNLFCQQNSSDSFFIHYLIMNNILDENEFQYLTDKNLLYKIPSEYCYDSIMWFSD